MSDTEYVLDEAKYNKIIKTYLYIWLLIHQYFRYHVSLSFKWYIVVDI